MKKIKWTAQGTDGNKYGNTIVEFEDFSAINEILAITLLNFEQTGWALYKKDNTRLIMLKIEIV